MDFGPVYQQLFTTFWYLIPLLIIVGLIKSPWFKGKFGEFLVNLSARCFLDKSRYHLIKNVTLPTEDGTTQIDHVLVSEFGVFVVETKNMKGWIFGRLLKLRSQGLPQTPLLGAFINLPPSCF